MPRYGLAALALIAVTSGATAAATIPPPVIPTSANQFTAAELADSIRFCAGHSESPGRLACFDEIAAALNAGLGPLEALMPANGGPEHAIQPGGGVYAWATDTGLTDDGTPSYTIALAATDVSIDSAIFAHSQATLTVRCLGKETHLFVSFDTPLDRPRRNVEVTVGNRLTTERWQPSESGASVGAWQSREALPVIRRMLEAKSASVRVAQADGRTVTARFDTSGMAGALTGVRAACGW